MAPGRIERQRGGLVVTGYHRAASGRSRESRAGFGIASSIRLSLIATLDRVKFETMSDQIVAELVGDQMLQLFYFIIAKLDHVTRLQVDQVIVMRARHL